MPYVRLKHHFTALSKALTKKQVPNVCCDVDEKNGSPFLKQQKQGCHGREGKQG